MCDSKHQPIDTTTSLTNPLYYSKKLNNYENTPDHYLNLEKNN